MADTTADDSAFNFIAKLDVLNGVPAYQPAVFADADGVVPPNPNAAPATPAAAGRGAGTPAAVEEIRALLQAAR